MDSTTLQTKLEKNYNKRYKNIEKRVISALYDSKVTDTDLSVENVRTLSNFIIEQETQKLEQEVEKLLEQKEAIERVLDKKSEELQEKKYKVFNILEDEFKDNNATLITLHQVKLQSIDLYEILSEMVESAIITALEKDTDGDITGPTKEVIKEITFESIKEGSLNTIRVRKILSTILATAIDVSEATPNRADEILISTLKGMRAGLIQSIDRFKKRLAFMPVEAKHILIEDYDTIIEDLNQTDTLFSQVVVTQASQSSQTIRKILLDLNKEMKYDLEELVHISKETAEVMRDRFSSLAKLAVKKADSALHSPKAKEAKRMGVQAFSVAKSALGHAIKSAKDAIDKKDK
jgi:iron-sulfur cluster repair protein YtfE (RIC family)